MKRHLRPTSLLLAALLLGACASAPPPTPVTTIGSYMTVHQARQEVRGLTAGGMLCKGTSVLDERRSITDARVDHGGFTLDGRRFSYADITDLALVPARTTSASSFVLLGRGTALFTGGGAGGNARARRLADALLILKAAASLEAVEQEQAQFDDVVRDYRAADPKPPVTEDMRRYEIQAEAAVRARQFEQAADLYDTVLQGAPWWPQGHFNRALILESLDEYDLAAEEMQRYLKLVPDAPNARAAQDKIYEWEMKVGNSR